MCDGASPGSDAVRTHPFYRPTGLLLKTVVYFHLNNIIIKRCVTKNFLFLFHVFFQIIDLPLQPILKIAIQFRL